MPERMADNNRSSNNRVSHLLLAGTCACAADAATFPIDTVKVRLQTQAAGESCGIVQTVRSMAAAGGARSFYNGLGAGLQRQFAFASIRIGFYEPVKQKYMSLLGVEADSGTAVLGVRLLAGVTTGALAVCVAQPTDVVKVRMQSGSSGAAFSSSLAAYPAIFRTEGLAGLWRGVLPNIARNGIVNCAEVVSYDTIKTYLMSRFHLQDKIGTHFASGLASGFIATVVASPVDVVKTRMMSSSGSAGVLAVAAAVRSQSGWRGFYRGFVPSFARIAAWNILMFVAFEQAKKAMAELPARTERLRQLKQPLVH